MVPDEFKMMVCCTQSAPQALLSSFSSLGTSARSRLASQCNSYTFVVVMVDGKFQCEEERWEVGGADNKKYLSWKIIDGLKNANSWFSPINERKFDVLLFRILLKFIPNVKF